MMKPNVPVQVLLQYKTRIHEDKFEHKIDAHDKKRRSILSKIH
jgi:hypothetical protein